jgi:hypothetical protein
MYKHGTDSSARTEIAVRYASPLVMLGFSAAHPTEVEQYR